MFTTSQRFIITNTDTDIDVRYFIPGQVSLAKSAQSYDAIGVPSA